MQRVDMINQRGRWMVVWLIKVDGKFTVAEKNIAKARRIVAQLNGGN